MDQMLGIERAVAGLAVVPLMPAGRRANTANDPVPLADPEPRDETSGLSFYIEYDGGELGTARRITVRRVHIQNGEIVMLHAVCHERHALRNFRIDRICEAIDIATGEVITADRLCAMLMNRRVPLIDLRLAAISKVLVFMAHCDGHHHYLEWDAIDSALLRMSRILLDDDVFAETLIEAARGLSPDGHDFMKALRGLQLTRLPKRVHSELRRAIGAVIDADGRQAKEEVVWAVEAAAMIDKMPTSD